jgi:tRNA(fMet)-specific endonuclease VapC
MGSLSFLLDSNVLAELTKPQPDAGVLEKLAEHRSALATTAVALHELALGVAQLTDGARKARLQEFINGLVECGMAILPYDQDAALWHAREQARRQSSGLATPLRDGQIAAVAASRKLTLVSRNLADFQHFQGLSSTSWFSE